MYAYYIEENIQLNGNVHLTILMICCLYIHRRIYIYLQTNDNERVEV